MLLQVLPAAITATAAAIAPDDAAATILVPLLLTAAAAAIFLTASAAAANYCDVLLLQMLMLLSVWRDIGSLTTRLPLASTHQKTVSFLQFPSLGFNHDLDGWALIVGTAQVI